MTIQILSSKIQEQVTEEAPQPSKREIEDYYEAAKSSQFTTAETRDIRVIKNKDKAKVEAAKAALEKDDSTKSWAKVAKKYSTDTTKSSGGLQAGVTEGAAGRTARRRRLRRARRVSRRADRRNRRPTPSSR